MIQDDHCIPLLVPGTVLGFIDEAFDCDLILYRFCTRSLFCPFWDPAAPLCLCFCFPPLPCAAATQLHYGFFSAAHARAKLRGQGYSS